MQTPYVAFCGKYGSTDTDSGAATAPTLKP
jgi:hypothetical protein